jgi:hypothetical protein
MTTEQLALKAAIGYVERNTPQLAHSEISAELRRLAAIEAATRKLVTAKGRYHTEQNYRALEALIKGAP